MEVIKRKILQKLMIDTAVCTGCTGMCTYYTTGGTYYVKYGCTKNAIKPDLNAVYQFKIGLDSIAKDIGFFDVAEYIPYYSYGNLTLPVGLENIIE